MILTIPRNKVNQIQMDMNSYANGNDSKKFILFAKYLIYLQKHTMRHYHRCLMAPVSLLVFLMSMSLHHF
jgi:hypothetical protein